MSTASAFPITRRALPLALALSLPVSALRSQTSHAVPPFAFMPASAGVHAAKGNLDVRIDGQLDERVWRLVKPVTEFVQREPKDGAPATVATDVRMIITDDAVIIGARLQDDRAALASAVASALGPQADGVPGGFLDDYFEVQIDPHPAHLTALAFNVAPGGRHRSWIVARDGTRDESWNVDWTSATRIDASGWTVEMRIPLSEFHVAPGTERWAVQFVRFSWNRQETDVLKSPSSNPVVGLSRLP